ncbi:MAG: hypothetical protein LBF57_04140, partial [Holosporaceae bacterium]|nr:hypothetical protein [Holosporaceae bacterium]
RCIIQKNSSSVQSGCLQAPDYQQYNFIKTISFCIMQRSLGIQKSTLGEAIMNPQSPNDEISAAGQRKIHKKQPNLDKLCNQRMNLDRSR